MASFWQSYQVKFQEITPREQMMILLTGVVAIVFIVYSFYIDENSLRSQKFVTDIKQIESSIVAKQQTVEIFKQALSEDPNTKTTQHISQYENKLGQIDTALLSLTSDLIDPIQMRFALIDLLKLQKGVSLLSFDVIAAQPISLSPELENTDETVSKAESSTATGSKVNSETIPSLTLYKHGIKLTLSGSYFKLRDYLSTLEQLKWTFFWHKFDYKLKQYPVSELEIELYSLSTKKEFVGV